MTDQFIIDQIKKALASGFSVRVYSTFDSLVKIEVTDYRRQIGRTRSIDREFIDLMFAETLERTIAELRDEK